MSLINQFEVMLEDFVPKVSDGKFITDRIRGTTTTVSDRLYTRMRAYAIDNQLPLDALVRQLREEIHQQPMATNDLTCAAPKFAKGDRVKLTSKGIQLIPSMDMHCSGTIVFTPLKGQWVAVCWDGTVVHRYIDPSLLERSDV
jgi:hypothetical protein